MRMGIVLLNCETQFVGCFNLMESTVSLLHFNFTPHSKNVIANAPETGTKQTQKKVFLSKFVSPVLSFFVYLERSFVLHECGDALTRRERDIVVIN